MNTNNHFEDGVMLYVFFFVTITFVAISGVQTYLGYSALLGWGAIPFAIAISLLLLFLNLALRLHRIQGKGIIGVSFVLMIVILFSFMGNFNAIYHAYTGDEAKEGTLSRARVIFRHNMETAKKSLAGSEKYKEYLDFKEKIDLAKTNIRRQITDGLNRGYGEKAIKEVAKAEKLLKIKLTDRAAPPGNTKGISYWKGFADDIIADIEKSERMVVKRKFGQWSVLGEIDALIQSVNISETDAEGSQARDNISLSQLKEDSETIRSKVEVLLGNKTLDFTEITTDAGRTDNIADTFKTAFNERLGLETWLVALVSLLLDLFVPMVTLVYYKEDDGTNNQGTQPVGSGGIGHLKDHY